MVIDKDGTIKYAKKEPDPRAVTVRISSSGRSISLRLSTRYRGFPIATTDNHNNRFLVLMLSILSYDFRLRCANTFRICLTNYKQIKIKSRLESAEGPLLLAPRTELTLWHCTGCGRHLATHDMCKQLSETHARTFSIPWTG